MTESGFFAGIAPFTSFAGVCDARHYHEAPRDWWVVITDVEGSTSAIAEGRYKDVNALGVCSIIAVLNVVGAVDVPYVFGGDGATMLVPTSAREAVERALAEVRALARRSLGLSLRVGLVPVAEVQDSGHRIEVARFAASPQVALAMFRGGGLAHAEKLVKSAGTSERYRLALPDPESPDGSLLEGFECRWNPLASRHGVMVSLLVQSRGGTSAYADVLADLESIAGTTDGRYEPTSAENLSLATDPAAFSAEAGLKTGERSGLRFRWQRLRIAMLTALGRHLLASGRKVADFDGASYAGEVAANTDFRKFDDCLRMVLDLTREQADQLEAALARRHARGELVYGMHRSEAALMTCLVRSHRGNHVHFVDGSHGGYAFAARQLKRQLATLAG